MLLLISGSLRTGSVNTKLLRAAAKIYGGDSVLADVNFPLYNGDIEESEGVPPAVQALSDQIKNAEAVVIASPEYNQCLSGVLKNALDWISRTEGGPWRGKPVALVNAAAGRTGGARANYSLRLAMAPFQTRLIQGPEVLVATASTEFDDDGNLTNERYLKALTTLMERLKEEARG
ncbi:MAG: NAD(P)H-dependent oxidoreductase [Pseudomonadota bacterium]